MNAARLARKWSDAKGDPALITEAPADAIDEPAIGLLSRDFLRAELTEPEGRLVARIAQLETRMVEIETRVHRVEIQLGTRIAELATRLLWRLIAVWHPDRPGRTPGCSIGPGTAVGAPREASKADDVWN